MEHLLADLSDDQRSAVTADESTLAVLAAAGAGKTRVLTRRVAWRIATETGAAQHTLVVTFTRKAASELRERLAAMEGTDAVASGTFHSVAWAQLRARWSDRGIRPPRLIDRRTSLFAAALDTTDRDAVRAGLAEHDWARARLIAPADYPEHAAQHRRRPPLRPDALVAAFERFAQLKRTRRVVDFDDVLALARRDLDADEQYAAAIRWRFQHLYVDEFQDVNPLQVALLGAWRGGRDELTVVGDPDQAIYGFNGAEPSYLRGFVDHFGGRVVELRDNYRSAPPVVVAATTVLDHRRAPPPCHQPPGPAPLVRSHVDEHAEAAAVARAVRDAHAPGTSWSAQAVLVRTHAQSEPIQAALAAVGIPYRVRGGRHFVDHPAVRAAVGLLGGHSGRLRDAMADLRALPTDDLPGDAAAHLSMVVRLATDQLRIDPDVAAGAFAELLGTAATGEVIGPITDAVDIVTFHAAKGLEWPVVHVTGLEDGLVPSWWATDDAQRAEELRLLYVAMTRARTHLGLHWARRRTLGRTPVERKRSPFLDPLDSTDDTTDAEPTGQITTSAAIIRGRVAVATTEPTATADDRATVTEALQAWRDRAARAAGVEAAAVLSDDVIDEVARRRPTSPADLDDIEGLSPVRRSRYGATLVELVLGATADDGTDTATDPTA